MASKFTWIALSVFAIALNTDPVQAQNPASDWRKAGKTVTDSDGEPSRPVSKAGTESDRGKSPRSRVAKVSMSHGSLPNDHGQLWREYDISPYTLQVATTNRPEQAVVDWILQETGYETWHTEPLALLSANRRSLYVYHTAEMQQVVNDIVDRFVSNDADSSEFSLHVITVGSPNWRTRTHSLLETVPVQTPGVQAWVMEREAAVSLLAEVGRRTDFRKHSSPQQIVNNGQSTVVSSTRSQYYVRDVRLTGNTWPGYQAETAVVDEGFSLEFSPLLSVDRQAIDAIVKCHINRLEKMEPVMLDVPTAVAPRQRTKIEIPQLAHFQFHERFRWTPNKVLLICMSLIPLPNSAESKPLVPGLPIPGVGSTDNRGDLLVFIEAKQASSATPSGARTAASPYRGVGLQ